MPNYSEIVQQEVAKQKAADCGFFHSDPLPEEVQKQLNAAPPLPAPGQPYTGTPDQYALLRWMNIDAAKAEARKTYCGSPA